MAYNGRLIKRTKILNLVIHNMNIIILQSSTRWQPTTKRMWYALVMTYFIIKYTLIVIYLFYNL
jgi:hypothetical protein